MFTNSFGRIILGSDGYPNKVVATDAQGSATVNFSDFPYIGRIFARYLETGLYLGNQEIMNKIRISINSNGKRYNDTLNVSQSSSQSISIKLDK